MQNVLLRILPVMFLACGIQACKSTGPAMETRNLGGIDIHPQNEGSAAYQPSTTRHFNLIHTSLDVRFDYERQRMPATAVITLKPHFYPADSVCLDARGMLLHRVAKINGKDTSDIPYRYNADSLLIRLGKTYTANDTLTLFISYTACPEELKNRKAGTAVREDKGLYFINPSGKEKGKPRQIWTQSETQSASVWYPTIDAPNQKMTQEIRMTVDSADVTLSNGILVQSRNNNNGTRTDTWRMDLPHAPYLSMMAVGPFSIVKDQWRGKEVSYYVEPPYKNVARKIFGNTPEMMEFFSSKLGVDYPWQKYSQVVVRDFVSGAMENTTATVHTEELQQNERQLLDETYEDYVSHELFHQWFGDLVTCESWANTPLNESFATYGEYLWKDYKYGRDEADYARLNDLLAYLREAKTKQVNLIRYYHENPDDMFDRHSYQKGGCILHLLRHEIGDEAFFSGLKNYLKQHQYQSVEIHDLRLAFEKTTGRDLNWFFDQWFLDKGHPVLDIRYNYNAVTKNAEITVRQFQDTAGIRLFRLPLAVDVYTADGVQRSMIVVDKKEETFKLPVSVQPLLINVDADKTLVGQKTDHHTAAEWIYQYYHAPLFLDRLESVRAMPENYPANGPEAKLLKDATADKHWHIRASALGRLNAPAYPDSAELLLHLENLAKKDPKPAVRAVAIYKISERFHGTDRIALYRQLVKDSSYTVMATAMEALSAEDSLEALKLAITFESQKDEEVRDMVTGEYAKSGGPEQAEYMHTVMKETVGSALYSLAGTYGRYLQRMQQEPILSEGIVNLANAAKNAQPWYVRFASMQALSDLQNTIQNRRDLARQKGNVAESEMYTGLNEKTQALMISIRDSETDETLRRIYGSQNKK